MIARKDRNGPGVETNKVILYGHLFKALKDGLYESCLQPHEDSKDGLAVMNSIIHQHGGTAIWEKLILRESHPWILNGTVREQRGL